MSMVVFELVGTLGVPIKGDAAVSCTAAIRNKKETISAILLFIVPLLVLIG